LGRTVTIDDDVLTVIGVAARGFHGIEVGPTIPIYGLPP